MKQTKIELLASNERYRQSLVNYRLEVEELRVALKFKEQKITNLEQQINRTNEHTKYLSKDLDCYAQLCEMLSSELLTARIEIQRQRYDARSVATAPDQQSEVKVPCYEPDIKVPVKYDETLMKVVGTKK